jgi:succinyl-CoA synthetase alpha subunit
MDWTMNSTVLVQGITTPLGQYYTAEMKAYGMNIVAGASVGWGGECVNDIPIFDLVEQAIARFGAIDISLIFVEPYAVLDAALEAIASGIRKLILVTRGVPPLDTLRLIEKARRTDTLILGPGSAGLIIPGQIVLGAIEPQFYSPGNIGMIGRTDNLINEIAWELTQANLGQSIAVNLGTGEIAGSNFQTWLSILDKDENTDAILLIEQNLSGDREAAIEYIKAEIRKPVIAYIAGCHIPQQQPIGAPAFMLADCLAQPIPNTSTAEMKMAAFKKAKVPIAHRPSQIPGLMQKVLRKKVNKLSVERHPPSSVPRQQ